MRRKCSTPRNYQGRGGIPKIEASCLRSHCLCCLDVFVEKKIFWGFMWEGETNTSEQVGGGVFVCGGTLTPTLTALISHLTTRSNGQTIII